MNQLLPIIRRKRRPLVVEPECVPHLTMTEPKSEPVKTAEGGAGLAATRIARSASDTTPDVGTEHTEPPKESHDDPEPTA